MEWMILPLKRYADFRGRSRRKEYWMFTLFNFLVSLAFNVIQIVVGGGLAASTATGLNDSPADPSLSGLAGVGVIGLIQLVWLLALIVPSLAVSVRRLHDIDRTGWWLGALILLYVVLAVAAVVGLAPLIFSGSFGMESGSTSHVGALVVAGIALLAVAVLGLTLFVFACFDGTRGSNRFGPDPKGSNEELNAVFR